MWLQEKCYVQSNHPESAQQPLSPELQDVGTAEGSITTFLEQFGLKSTHGVLTPTDSKARLDMAEDQKSRNWQISDTNM
jgi:G:T/U-mismatch repair DNA glycosylase